ncbi:MAG TPA: dihydropteroate synthase [Nocardioidaceae bacterium]|nr:dihydropteroate synthase [Nocardioidaceae bacterium]
MYAGPPSHVAGLPELDRALVMGVLNVTPDSFSDGGRWFDTGRAVEHGRRLVAQGADLVDVGGESTRPGASRPTAQEEQDRILPVITALAAEGVTISVDTMRAEVARAAVDAGAVLVNDVSGGRADPAMFETVADLEAPYVLMHWRAHSVTMQQQTRYADVVADVMSELRAQLDLALAAGIAPERIALDPGIGFSKTADQNWEVLAATERFHELGHPLLVATSRKRFLGVLLADDDGTLRPPLERDDATTATTALAAGAGAWCIRAHAVRPTADAVRVAARWAAAGSVTGRVEPAGASAGRAGSPVPGGTP